MALLVLQPDNTLHQMLPVMYDIAGLFLNVSQHNLRQCVFIDRVNRAYGLPAAGIVPAEKRTVPSRPAVLVSKPLNLIAHLKPAVRAADNPGKDA